MSRRPPAGASAPDVLAGRVADPFTDEPPRAGDEYEPAGPAEGLARARTARRRGGRGAASKPAANGKPAAKARARRRDPEAEETWAGDFDAILAEPVCPRCRYLRRICAERGECPGEQFAI